MTDIPRMKRVQFDMKIVHEVHQFVMDSFQMTGQPVIAHLVLAAIMIQIHAKAGGTAIDDVADIVRTYAKQIERGVPLDASERFRNGSV